MPEGSGFSRAIRSAVILSSLSFLAASGCRATNVEDPVAAYPPVESASLGTMRNVSVSGVIWFGGAPSEADFELAQRRGVKTVIDLSTPAEQIPVDAAEVCARLGMEYHHPAVPSDAEPGGELVDLVIGMLARDKHEPKLLFCESGSRCAMFLAIFRATEVGVPLEAALVEARRACMRPQDEDFVRAQVLRRQGRNRTAAPDGGPSSASAPNGAGAASS